MKTSRAIATRVALVYAVASGAWILGSGWLVIGLPKPLEGFVEIGKGLMFVAFTSFLLYLTISRWTEVVAAESRRTSEVRRQLQQVIDTVPVGVVLLDPMGAVTFMNPASARLLGVHASESVGKQLDALLGPATGAESAVLVGELLSAGWIDGLEFGSPADGISRTLIARAVDLDPKAPGSGWIVALADNSSTHAELARSARLLAGYRFLAEMTSVIACATTAEELLSQVCGLAVKVGGFSAAWAMTEGKDGVRREAGSAGMSLAALEIASHMRDGTPDEAARMMDRLSSSDLFIDNDIPSNPGAPWQRLSQEPGYGSCVMFGIVEAGVLRAGLALFAAEVGFFDEEEKRLVSALKNDLRFTLDRLALESARSAAEEALSRSAADYRCLFDANPQPMYVHDSADLRFLAVNDAAVAKYGFTREQFAKMTIKDIRPADELPQLAQQLQQRRTNTGLADAGYWTHLDAKGREFPVHALTHTLEWEGHAAVLVMIEEVAKMG